LHKFKLKQTRIKPMGIELIAAIAGTAIAIPATCKLIDKLIN
jgi:hypothetical protein